MEADVKAGRFLEHGEYDGNLYGTKIDSIHEVVAMGRTCILDVNPQVWEGSKASECQAGLFSRSEGWLWCAAFTHCVWLSVRTLESFVRWSLEQSDYGFVFSN